MNEYEEKGWLCHLVLGTGHGLKGAGPSICRTPAGIRLFLHIKTFEVCRCMMYNDSTFLAENKWQDASCDMQSQLTFPRGWKALDSLLNIMVECADLPIQ